MLTHGIVDGTARIGFLLWSRLVSPGDGPRCVFQPSCSLYARQALTRDGWLGVPETFDRLVRESGAYRYDPAPDEAHFDDPLGDHLSGRALRGSGERGGAPGL